MKATESTEGRSALGRSLLAAGSIPAGWAAALDAVPRAGFLPELMWPFDMVRRTSAAVCRGEDPAGWQRYADADVPIVTQWDDGEHRGPEPGKESTSSSSMPSVVFGMLGDLDVRDGDTALEIGTGTGWNAGLLAHRLGDARVTTVEVDPAVAAAARAALRGAGLRPTVVTGDGLAGHAARAPYDRIIATCGVRAIPYAWVEQAAPGGVIVAPWGTHFGHGDAVVRLRVGGGEAAGRFTRPVEFMKLRAQRTGVRHADRVPARGTGDADRSVTAVTAEEFAGDRFGPAAFALGLRVRDCVRARAEKRGDTRPVRFYGRTDASWAVVTFRDGHAENQVWQCGPRRLWDEVEAAFRWWVARGRPGPERFGLTVDRAGQHVWLDTPRVDVTRPDEPPT